MKIAESAVQFFSEHTLREQHHKKESLTTWKAEPGRAAGRAGRGGRRHQLYGFGRGKADRVNLSGAGVKRRHVNPRDLELTEKEKMESDLNIRLLKSLVERLTGRTFDLAEIANGDEQIVEAGDEMGGLQEEGVGFGVIYDYHESRYEYESMDFQADGIIKTEDGMEIDFSVTLSMSREFYIEQNIQIGAGDALKDPLVINFSGNGVQLSQRDFHFDIDSDGTPDQIAFVGPGNGFLALDKDGNGQIDNGSELFGTHTGNGFQELAPYDTDGNNWIDENDAIYDKLRIWSRGPDGKTSLVALGKAGVGAIYLGNTASPFSIKDSRNELLGQVRSTGIALMESGRVVTMQQVDLVA
jgi:hypothetical protein